jgi:FMN-dependent NADH-azoreductase
MNSMQSGRVLMILFNIQASPRGSKSISIAATHAFVEAYRRSYSETGFWEA